MMGRLKSDQGQLFYEFRLGDAVPEDPEAISVYVRSKAPDARRATSVIKSSIARRLTRGRSPVR
jgi:hypothetical protein